MNQSPPARTSHAELAAASTLVFRTPLQDHLANADSKAAGLLTFLGVMFTLLARMSSTIGMVFRNGGGLAVAAALLLGIFVVLAVGVIVQCFRTITPRFPRVDPSLAFFGDIARLPRDEYLDRVQSLSLEQAIDHMLRYNHTASTICVEKFRHLARAIRLFEWAAATWLVLILILSMASM